MKFNRNNRKKDYWPSNDLFIGSRPRRKRPRGRIYLLLAVLLVGGFWLWQRGDVDDVEVFEEDDTFSVAMWIISDSVEMAYLETISEHDVEYDDELDDFFEDAKTAVWEQGQPVVLQGELVPNESVFLALQKRNISASAIHHVVQATGKKFNFRRSRPGDSWYADVNEDGVITEFRYQNSPQDIWVTRRAEDGTYTCTKEEITIEIKLDAITGVITSNLWNALEAAGGKGAIAQRFMELFAYVVDFSAETRAGDRFAAVYEKQYSNGEFLRYGRILAAKYVGQSGARYAFYFNDESHAGYYDEEGDSLQRQFLRSPLPFTRITSGYGMRYHPILKARRMHHGVDYGAPTGTPVYAAADGVVSFAGWRGANGNLIVLRHSGGYETLYAHLSSIGRGVRRGRRVSRGEVIGRVGSTGRSTAPHLHYGMKRNGKYVNPSRVESTRDEPLKGQALKRYKSDVVQPLLKQLKELSSPGEVELKPLQAVEQPSISPG